MTAADILSRRADEIKALAEEHVGDDDAPSQRDYEIVEIVLRAVAEALEEAA